MHPELTDAQLATIIRHLVRKHLEIERGLRPPEHLHGVMTPHAYRRLRSSTRAHFDRQGPVHPRDLGHVRMTRYPDGRVHAAVATREQDDRWGSVVMQLRILPNRKVRITSLERLRRGMFRHRSRGEQAQESIEDRLRRVDDEHRLVQAALRAEQRRLADGDPRSSPDDRSMVPSFEERVRQLDAERRELLRGRSHNQVGADSGQPPLPDHIRRILGSRPEDADLRSLWEAAYVEIARYRDDWNIDAPTALGPLPFDDELQRRHHDHVVERLRAVRQVLEVGSPDPLERESLIR